MAARYAPPCAPSPPLNPMAPEFTLFRGGLSLAAAAGMVGVGVTMLVRLRRRQTFSLPAAWWTIPLLGLISLGIALYLTYTEWVPCAGCEVWPYGRLLATFPIGQTSLLGAVLLLAAWSLSLFSADRLQAAAPYAVLAVASVRLLLAIYLTFLEPFLLGATCAWCLVSAVLTTITFWLSAEVVVGLRLSSYFE